MEKTSRSSVRRTPVGKNLKPIPDSQIDFSDIPELSDAQLAAMRRIGRSPEDSNNSRRQAVTKKLQQLRRCSATLTGNEIVAASKAVEEKLADRESAGNRWRLANLNSSASRRPSGSSAKNAVRHI